MGAIIVLGILGPIILWSGLRLIKKAAGVKKWHQIEVELIRKGAKLSDKPNTSRGAKYELDVAYEFTFEGKHYSSTSYSHMTTMATEKDRLKKAEKLPNHMTAFVNPDNPEESFLVTPSIVLAYIITGIGAAMLVALVPLVTTR